MWIDPVVLFWIVVLVTALAAALALRNARVLRRRYDRFRIETAEVMSQHQARIDDIDRRLGQAGYPPGRL